MKVLAKANRVVGICGIGFILCGLFFIILSLNRDVFTEKEFWLFGIFFCVLGVVAVIGGLISCINFFTPKDIVIYDENRKEFILQGGKALSFKKTVVPLQFVAQAVNRTLTKEEKSKANLNYFLFGAIGAALSSTSKNAPKPGLYIVMVDGSCVYFSRPKKPAIAVDEINKLIQQEKQLSQDYNATANFANN